MSEFKIISEPVNMATMKRRVCCNCGNNIRQKEEQGHIECYCAINGHYIGYVACFEHWCNHWRKDKKEK